MGRIQVLEKLTSATSLRHAILEAPGLTTGIKVQGVKVFMNTCRKLSIHVTMFP